MTSDTTDCDERTESRETTVPPLCLVYYLAGRTENHPEPDRNTPDVPRRGRVAERRGNLIVLEFTDPPVMQRALHRKRWQGTQGRKSLLARGCDLLLGLLLLASLYACLAALRF